MRPRRWTPYGVPPTTPSRLPTSTRCSPRSSRAMPRTPAHVDTRRLQHPDVPHRSRPSAQGRREEHPRAPGGVGREARHRCGGLPGDPPPVPGDRPSGRHPAGLRLLAAVVDEVFPIEPADVEATKAILLSRGGLSSREALHVAVMQRRDVRWSARVLQPKSDQVACAEAWTYPAALSACWAAFSSQPLQGLWVWASWSWGCRAAAGT